MNRVGGFRLAPVLTILLLCSSGIGLSAPLSARQAKAVGRDDNPKDHINIVAAKLDYFDKEQKLVYSGNVVAVRGDTTLKTPLLVVFLTPKQSGAHSRAPSSTNAVRRMEAAGPVTLISKDQVATGNSGVYVKGDDKVYINGNVSLTQGPNVTTGDHVIYDVKTGQAVVTGNVRSMFIPDSDSGDGSK